MRQYRGKDRLCRAAAGKTKNRMQKRIYFFVLQTAAPGLIIKVKGKQLKLCTKKIIEFTETKWQEV